MAVVPPPAYQYAPPPQVVGPAPGIRYAAWFSRLVAYLIDGFILGIVIMAFYLIGFVALASGTTVSSDGTVNPGGGVGIGLLVFLLGVVVGFLWKPFFWSHGGQTPGYKLLGMRVVRARDGGPVGFGTGVLRMIGYIINDVVFGIPLGFIWAAFDNAKQGWHDKIAGTVVIQA